jgi:glycosyltransferase involved in cell wall biosynthesis
MAAGLPVVTTSIGAEGLDATDGADLQIADDPDDFTHRLLRIYSDPELWLKQSMKGRELVARVSSPSVQKAALTRLLERSRLGASLERVHA